MKTEVLTIYLETDGTNATGTFVLKSPDFANTPNYLQLDKGLKAKIWAKEVSGAPLKLYMDYTDDVTVTTPAWITIDSEELSSEGIYAIEKRRPRIIRFRTGKEAIRFRWEQTTAAKSYVVLEIEVEPGED